MKVNRLIATLNSYEISPFSLETTSKLSNKLKLNIILSLLYSITIFQMNSSYV